MKKICMFHFYVSQLPVSTTGLHFLMALMLMATAKVYGDIHNRLEHAGTILSRTWRNAQGHFQLSTIPIRPAKGVRTTYRR